MQKWRNKNIPNNYNNSNNGNFVIPKNNVNNKTSQNAIQTINNDIVIYNIKDKKDKVTIIILKTSKVVINKGKKRGNINTIRDKLEFLEKLESFKWYTKK